MNITLTEIEEKLRGTGYCTNQEINYAVLIALNTNRPLLIEGAPGVGKTSLAKAVADAFGLPFLRVQMYDGLTDDKILYDCHEPPTKVGGMESQLTIVGTSPRRP